jgi:hypothetical protein
MFGSSQTFNNLLNGNTFNRLFADTPTPSDPVIDLSSGGETEEYDSHNNNQASRKRHHSAEVTNVAKRKAHESLLTESQKNRNRNMPLKKRGTANREEELSFLNLLANENSNQAQNLVKLECANDSSTCDSSSSVHPKRYLNLEPTEKDIVCDCFNCFPVLGSKGAPKCKKLRKSDDSGSSAGAIDATMIPGPSGLQQKKTILPPAKKRNYYETDSDDSDDQIEIPDSQQLPPILIEDEPIDDKTAALTAPDLQLDWLSDSSPEDDDDVIFVSDRTAPIDLTADSDTDNAPSPADAVSIDRNQNGSANDYSTRSVRNSPALDPAIASSRYIEPYYCLQIPPPNEPRVLHPTTVLNQRAPIMSSVATSSVPTQNSASPPRVIINIPTPPLHTPAPRQPNFRSMITGNDVMLYDGQNYVPRFMRESPSNPPNPEATVNDDANHATAPRQRAPSLSPGSNHHQRRNYNLPSTTNYYRPPSPNVFRSNAAQPPNNPPENPVVPPNAHQNCRQHVGRCPFMTEGHHYNRPRRFTRDFYSMSNGRPPYAVHEDLWRRQYQEQEIRRHYWSPSFNENAAEVQVLRPPPATPYSFGAEQTGGNSHHRLVTALSDNNNNNTHNNVTNSTDSLRNFDRLRHLQQPNAHTRYRRAAPW